MTKIIYLIGLLITMTNLTFGQAETSEKEISNAEKFFNKSGALIQKEFFDIGDLKKCNIQIARFTDIINNQKINAVRIVLVDISSPPLTGVAYLDADEIDGLVKSINIIQEKVLPNVATNMTSVSFKSKGGLVVSCSSNKESWIICMKIEGTIGVAYVFLDDDDLPKLIELLEQSKSKL
jgi:hypothetical protein